MKNRSNTEKDSKEGRAMEETQECNLFGGCTDYLHLHLHLHLAPSSLAPLTPLAPSQDASLGVKTQQGCFQRKESVMSKRLHTGQVSRLARRTQLPTDAEYLSLYQERDQGASEKNEKKLYVGGKRGGIIQCQCNHPLSFDFCHLLR